MEEISAVTDRGPRLTLPPSTLMAISAHISEFCFTVNFWGVKPHAKFQNPRTTRFWEKLNTPEEIVVGMCSLQFICPILQWACKEDKWNSLSGHLSCHRWCGARTWLRPINYESSAKAMDASNGLKS
jgi:hypothetical protein